MGFAYKSHRHHLGFLPAPQRPVTSVLACLLALKLASQEEQRNYFKGYITALNVNVICNVIIVYLQGGCFQWECTPQLQPPPRLSQPTPRCCFCPS